MADEGYAKRIKFLDKDQIMDVDLSNLTFEVSGQVNDFYDEVDRRLEESGQKWFFLVNYYKCRIMSEAWITYAHRGKKANLAYSLGTARYAAGRDTSDVILEKSKEDDFDPSLFPSRDAAIAHLRVLRSKMPASEFASAIKLDRPAPLRTYESRVTFYPELQVMECDFSDMTFERSASVHGFYDALERQLAASGRKWFFLVNYRNCSILPDAWIAFASRGKKLNLRHSLGTVRFDTGPETARAIVEDSRRENFDPSLFASRESALERIGEMRRALHG
jgi:hypothetical protein